MDDRDLAPFLGQLADAAGAAILPYFRNPAAEQDKSQGGVFDPVTEGDRAGERVMRALIGERFPEHGILGEEYGTQNGEAEHVWVLDPIDGTRAFISGIPVWGTLIGLTRHGRPVQGMMDQPFTGERYRGDGASAHYAGPGGPRVLRTRERSLAEATLMTTSPFLFSGEERAAYARVEAQVRLARYGCDCYAYCMLAAGHVDLVIESGLKPYDIVALIPIVEGAGGVVTSWEGTSAAGGGRILAAGSPALHREALALLAGAG